MTLPDGHAFFRVPVAPYPTSVGEVTLPIRYYEVTSVLGLFRAPLAAVAELLEGSALEPALTLGQDTLVAVAFYAYHRSSIGPYNEAGVATFVRRAGEREAGLPWLDIYRRPERRTVGTRVFDLPVTTPLACASGRELWGYPKFVTAIAVGLSGGRFEGVAADPEGRGDIVSLSGELGAWMPAPPMSVMLYSHLGGVLLRTHVHVRGAVRVHRGGGTVLRVGASPHPMAWRLRRLGLDGARPLAMVTTDAFQSLLHPGEPLAPASSRSACRGA